MMQLAHTWGATQKGRYVMAIRVKDLSQSATKWSRNAAGAASEYADNAEGSAEAWAQNTAAAAAVYFQAVSQGGIQQRFLKGVQRVGSSKYARRVRDLGAGRYSSGVQSAEGDWQEGFSPYAQTIAGLTLPGRRPRGDPGNLNRVAAVANALHARRIALLGA